ncbi:conserved hypothetical protein [Ricinus communis]|uniref:Uncharacterized protein n=1 Tax=Ricinus communis TaxID=3988 RepID=B9TL42_RICCO|nr:conserved hypothetical protein [Ricinus communis]
MVARQVGQHSDIEMHAIDTALRQAVGRYFHGHGVRTLLAIIRKLGLQQDGIGRGVGRRLERLWETVTQGADHSRGLAATAEALGQPMAARSLAVSAGNADHP